MEIDMSPEAITNRLKLMEQLWQLSINLMQAKEISETAILSEKSLGKDWKKENEAWKNVESLETV
jgi:hypothetical protein